MEDTEREQLIAEIEDLNSTIESQKDKIEELSEQLDAADGLLRQIRDLL